ncbi:histidine phosphatase family protein [Actinomadura sp. LD22]|uniref:Histidine phosphatase family protein n=1 Tax=Actinomadura physcomitrii TaxID=2650748 RepID=A0A6I4MBQ3_9ACTN|nr:histidine phosphatase family protein [Actinomadura physcomitrii]MWA03222.1 histidine phosphatase family protein [Actinomadura physcomitrii]
MRHGEPLRPGTGADPRDPGLSPRGRAQAAAAAARAAAWTGADAVEVLYASPLSRARETAGVVADRLGMDVRIEEGLAEFDRGARYLHYEDGADIWKRYLAGDLTPWGTTLGEFRDRVVASADRFLEAHRGRHVLAVCHGGVINVFANHVLGITHRTQLFPPEYASTSRFRWEGERGWQVLNLNEKAVMATDQAAEPAGAQ